MRIIRRRVECGIGDVFEVVFLGDLHVGSLNVEYGRLRSVIEYIACSENALWIGMGDYADAILPHPEEKRLDLEAIDRRFLTPEDQYDFIYELFKPIAGKCIVLLTGNHDERLRKWHYHDWVKELSEKLGVEYGGLNAYIRLTFKSDGGIRRLSIYASHGSFAGRTKTGRLRKLMDMRLQFDADVYVMGHVHDIDFTTTALLKVENGRVLERIQYYVLTGGFIRGYCPGSTSYIEERMLPPTRLGSAKIIVRPFDGRKPRIEFGEVP